MSIVRGKVLLCKARAQGDTDEGEKSYVKVLEARGFFCAQLSVLRFNFINLDELRSLLLTPNSHSGLILTSPRSAEAVGLAMENNKAEVEPVFSEIWSKLPTYCVGSATDRIARDYLNLGRCNGSETGSAKELAELVVNEAKSLAYIADGKPLLYPCSAIARDTLASTLESAGITLRKLCVYETLPSETLETDINEIFVNSPPEYLVFFSPSAVKHVTNAVKLNKQEKLLKQMKIVAIGPVTQQALLDAGLEVYATSKQPEPTALSNAIKNEAAMS